MRTEPSLNPYISPKHSGQFRDHVEHGPHSHLNSTPSAAALTTAADAADIACSRSLRPPHLSRNLT